MVIPDFAVFKRPCNFCILPNIQTGARFSRPEPICARMPKSRRQREEEEAELSAYTGRWLELADAALSATEKAQKSLELARQEQEHIRNKIKRRLDNYAKAGGRRVKKIG